MLKHARHRSRRLVRQPAWYGQPITGRASRPRGAGKGHRHCAWVPDLCQKDKMHNGTAATFVGLEDCNVKAALGPEPLRKAREEERKQFSIGVLRTGIVMALHPLSFLVQEVPSLAEHADRIRLRFRTTMAMHRKRRARKTKLHPLATSNSNEGKAGQNMNILYNLLVS
ncbi:hypothetical protein FIBSPDRAFT_878562 [Athelia psychrophila]|uniref:DUF6589 domain-containing protein n=1 Tax=Athelia psychrophila TaxID=1759441 RepID=A0A167UWB5_9AGAM|nr:hypothetical protein FIBSPDRAFT_878562 [Fibularhizoctonia sp. CBS 109695]